MVAPSGGFAFRRAPLLILGVASLVVAVYAGLVRVGWTWPAILEGLPEGHGALMVCGFLGTVIGLERAVALGRFWAYGAPVLAAIGAAAAVAGLPEALDLHPGVARALFLASAVALLVNTLVIARRQPALFTFVLALGVACWVAGNAFWLLSALRPEEDARWYQMQPLYKIVFWWGGFLVLTIASERLELSRVTRLTPTAVALFVGTAAVLLAGLVLMVARLAPGVRLTGAGLAATSLWLLRFDVARRTIRLQGLPKFIAAGLLSGYAWLAASGGFALRFGADLGTLHRDALYHSLFLGFVFSMIMAHAPVILPAVTGAMVPFTRIFYVPLALLHASLVLRVAADLAAWLPGREWGALLNAIAVIGFFGVVVGSVVTGRRAAG